MSTYLTYLTLYAESTGWQYAIVTGDMGEMNTCIEILRSDCTLG